MSKESTISTLRATFANLTGEDMSAADPMATFFELGLDSLVLTQASQTVQQQFGVRITFRQMMNELTSMDALAAFLEEKSPSLPSTPTPPVPPAPPESSSVPEPLPPPPRSTPRPRVTELPRTTSTVSTLPADTSVLERVVQQQLQVMAEQLEVLRRSGAQTAGQPITRVEAPPPSPGPVAEAAPVRKAPVVRAVKADHDETSRFGPFKGIERGPSGGVTERQERALAVLIERYNRRTAGSKAYAARNRSHFCDPRAAGNFRQLWKEMVYPIVCARSLGSRIWDIDGNEYIDVTMGFGSNYLGHSPEFVVQAIEEQLRAGFEIGPQSPQAGEVAQLVCEFTGFDRATFCNTGSEAVMAAIRVARTVTGRTKVVYFSGDYHGIFDEVLGRPALVDDAPGAMPIAPGVPHLANVVVLDYGSPASIETINRYAAEIAAVIVEPVQARHPDLQPREFLHELRQCTKRHEIALVFDEVITGFRAAPGGAQEYFGVRADLATYGKVVSGGMPIGVLAGTRRFMDALDGGDWRYGDDSFPETGVTFFAGTFVRHPLAMAAALASLKFLKARGPELQKTVNDRTSRFVGRANDLFQQRALPMRLQHFSAMFYYDFHPDLKLANLLFYYLRDRGVHIWEGRVGQLSIAHSDEDMDRVFDALRASVEEMQEAGFLPAAPATAAGTRGADTGTGDRASEPPVKDHIIPLTATQTEMWVGAQFAPEASGANNACNVVHLEGTLDIPALRRAIETVVSRHEGLRAHISPDGSGMVVTPASGMELAVHDLHALKPEDRAREVDRILSEDGRRLFDLERGPLVRFQLITKSATDHLLLCSLHMIICDGWSYNVVLEELGAVYSALVQGRQPDLPAAIPMGEYARQLARLRSDPEAARTEAYWLDQLHPVPPPMDLPVSKSRPRPRSFHGARLNLRLDEKLHLAIKRTAKALSNTPFTFLLSVYQAWLSRLSGQHDIVVGVPFAGQSALGLTTLVGQCVHTLPFRTTIDEKQPLAALLRQNRDIVVDSQEFWNTTFGALIQKLEIPADESRVPLVSVLFNIDPALAGVRFAGCACRITAGPRFYYQYDLGFNLVDEGATLLIECDYNTSLFEAETVGCWLAGFKSMLEGVVADPSQPVESLPILDTSEYGRIVNQWGCGQHRKLPAPTVQDWFSAQAGRTPGATAVEWGEHGLTYADVARLSNQLARHLLRIGCGPGAVACVLLPRTHQLPAVLLGVLKAGAAFCPLPPGLPPEHFRSLIADARAQVILTCSRFLHHLPPTDLRVVCVDEDGLDIVREDAGAIATPHESRLAYITFVSSSSRHPRAVEVSHPSLVNLLASLAERPGMAGSDAFLALTPVEFDMAIIEMLLPLVVGARTVIAEPDLANDPGRLDRALTRHAITMMQATPSTWRLLFNSGWKGFSDLKVWSGGEPLPPGLASKLATSCREVWNLYGTTETTVWSAVARVSADEVVTLGHPLANSQVYVVDASFQPVPVGVTGTILIGGLGVADGYRNHPELTIERFTADPFAKRSGGRLFNTGDLGRFTTEGALEFVGRRDGRISLRGFKIDLAEIESALLRDPRVREAAVILEDEKGSEGRLVAYLVHSGNDAETVNETRRSPLARELRKTLRATMPGFMVPAAFAQVSALPRTLDGHTVDRGRLPPIPDHAFLTGEAVVAPRSETEARLVAIWQETLKTPAISVQDSFFDLGGQSLLAVALFARIEREFGHKLPLATLFQAPTIEALAPYLSGEARTEQGWASLVPIQPEGDKSPLFLVHGAGGNVLLYRALGAHLSPDYPLYGLQSPGLDGEARPLESIEEMAEHYLRDVRAVQPHGPYCLGGYCLGGTVAYEMAQRLVQAGEPVALVAMLDTYNFIRALKTSFGRFMLQKFWFHLRNVTRLRPGQMKQYLFEKARIARDGELANLMTNMPGSTVQEGVARASSGAEASVQAFNDHAADVYQPQPYTGVVTLFKPRVNYTIYPDPKMGWGDLALGGLDIVELPINPHAMLVEPYVRLLADALKSRIDASEPQGAKRPAQSTAVSHPALSGAA